MRRMLNTNGKWRRSSMLSLQQRIPLPCAGVKEVTYNNWSKAKKIEWKCSLCRVQTRLGGSSGNQETAGTKRGRELEEEEEKGTPNKLKQQKSGDSNMDLKNDIIEIKNMICNMNTKNDESKKDLDFHIKTLNETITTLMQQITELTEKNKEKDAKIHKMELKINEMEQQSLENNIEISNVPLNNDENIQDTIQNLFKTIDVTLTTADIADAYRNKKNNIIIKLNTKNKKK